MYYEFKTFTDNKFNLYESWTKHPSHKTIMTQLVPSKETKSLENAHENLTWQIGDTTEATVASMDVVKHLVKSYYYVQQILLTLLLFCYDNKTFS